MLVIDELGNEYEKTYPKRAKGLAKNGRAYYIDETTICLKNNSQGGKIMANETKADIKAPEVLESINQVLKEQDDLTKLVESLAAKDLNKDQMKEMTRMIKEREKTNRRKLSTLRKIYDDVSGRHVRKSLMKSAKQAIKQGQQVDLNDLLNKINKTY